MNAIDRETGPVCRRTRLVSGIAFRRNLIALSAAIETACAGEHAGPPGGPLEPFDEATGACGEAPRVAVVGRRARRRDQ